MQIIILFYWKFIHVIVIDYVIVWRSHSQYLFYSLFAVLYECGTWKNKRCQYNNIILHFRTFHSSNQCIIGRRLHKCSKFGLCFRQHGWCCHDYIWQDLGKRIPVNHILVSFFILVHIFCNRLDNRLIFTMNFTFSFGTWLKLIKIGKKKKIQVTEVY